MKQTTKLILAVAAFAVVMFIANTYFAPLTWVHAATATVIAIVIYFYDALAPKEDETGREDPLVCWMQAAKTDLGKTLGMADVVDIEMVGVEFHTYKSTDLYFNYIPQRGAESADTIIHMVGLDGRKKYPHANRIFAHKKLIIDKASMEQYSPGKGDLTINRALAIVEKQLGIPKEEIMRMKMKGDPKLPAQSEVD